MLSKWMVSVPYAKWILCQCTQLQPRYALSGCDVQAGALRESRRVEVLLFVFQSFAGACQPIHKSVRFSTPYVYSFAVAIKNSENNCIVMYDRFQGALNCSHQSPVNAIHCLCKKGMALPGVSCRSSSRNRS